MAKPMRMKRILFCKQDVVQKRVKVLITDKTHNLGQEKYFSSWVQRSNVNKKEKDNILIFIYFSISFYFFLLSAFIFTKVFF